MNEVSYRIDRFIDVSAASGFHHRATAEIYVDGVGMVHVIVYGDDRLHALERIKVAVNELTGADLGENYFTETEDLIPYQDVLEA